MAFLCPARRKKSKIKIGGSRPLQGPIPGRITGSASIDTLVRVGLEKQHGTRTPMVVLHDFFPCVDDELDVKRNQLVHLLYQENDWMYVIAEDGREGFIPYTYCLPVQRSVDDFVVHKQKKKRDDDTERLISPPPYKTLQSASKSGSKPLVRSESKSMPDISDIGTNSSDSTGFVSKSSRHVYSQQNGHFSSTLGYSNKAFHKSHNSTNQSYDNGLFSNGDEPLLDTSVADIRNVSALIRRKQNEVIQSQKGSKTKNYAASVSGSRSAPSSPRSQHSSHSNVSPASHNTHSNHGNGGITHKHYQTNEITHRQNAGQNYRYVNTNSGNFQSFNQQIQSRGRSGSTGAVDSGLNKSWGPTSGQTIVRTGRTLNNSTNSFPGMYSSSRSYVNHPYGISSVHSNRHSNRHSYHSNPDQKSGSQTVKAHARKFQKAAQGQYIALYQFTAQQENDISVERGEFVTVLNKEDRDWYWIQRSDNQEGFVPSNYVRQADAIPIRTEVSQTQNSPTQTSATWSSNNRTSNQTKTNVHSSFQYSSQGTQNQQRTNQNTPRGSTRLVCLYDYRAQAPDDLSVTRGEWLYADLNKQDDPDWLWVFSPSQSVAGYIPRTYAKPPNFAFMQNNRDFGS